jgi:hypothetical protein
MDAPDLDWAEHPLAGTGITPGRATELAQGARPATPPEAGVAPALAAGWAVAAGADPDRVNASEGGVEIYDLGMRLRAAVTGQRQDRLSHRVAVGDWPLVAVSVTGCGTTATVTVERPGTAPVSGPLAGPTLTALTPRTSDEPFAVNDGRECLVVQARGDLTKLAAMAEASVSAPLAPRAVDDAAARLAWWLQRAEHPGGAAVLSVTDAAAQRWATGDAPAEASLDTWATWLGLDHQPRPTAVLLAAAEMLRGGELLPTLAGITRDRGRGNGPEVTESRADEDGRSWTAFMEGRAKRARWQAWDSPRSAALGLQSRSDAAEYFDRALLDDPRWAVRARFDGRVVVATVDQITGSRVVRLVAAQSACRYRPGSKLALRVRNLDPTGTATTELVPAEMLSTTMSATGRLVIEVDCYRPGQKLRPNRRVELVPLAASLGQMARGRKNLAERYTLASWARDRSAVPPVIHRSVPLDVMVAAADEF